MPEISEKQLRKGGRCDVMVLGMVDAAVKATETRRDSTWKRTMSGRAVALMAVAPR